jgi:hypothetical protein
MAAQAQAHLASLLRDEAEQAEARRASALRELAGELDALPANHPTSKVLRHLRPFEQREFPNAAILRLIANYGHLGSKDAEGFFDSVVDAVHPGMRPSKVMRPERPWWATLPFSPAVWLVWSIVRRRSAAPTARSA